MPTVLRRRRHAQPVSAPADLLWHLVSPLVRAMRHLPLAAGGILFPIVPILAAWPRRHQLSVPLRWVVVYLIVTLAEELFMLYWSRHGRHNLWIINLYTPIEAFMLAMMYAGWQLRERWRFMIYLSLAGFVAFWVLMMFTIEGFDTFPKFSKPVEALLVITASAWTLVQRSRHAASPLTFHPWFWVSVGTLLYFAYLLLLNPVGMMLLNPRPDLFRLAYGINGVLTTIMYLFWLRAIFLVRTPAKGDAPA